MQLFCPLRHWSRHVLSMCSHPYRSTAFKFFAQRDVDVFCPPLCSCARYVWFFYSPCSSLISHISWSWVIFPSIASVAQGLLCVPTSSGCQVNSQDMYITSHSCKWLWNLFLYLFQRYSLHLYPYEVRMSDLWALCRGEARQGLLLLIDVSKKDLISADQDTHGAVFVPVILGSDKTTVSVTTGQHEHHPVYMSIGNVCNHLWQAHKDALVLIGFLLIPKDVSSTTIDTSNLTVGRCTKRYWHWNILRLLPSPLPWVPYSDCQGHYPVLAFPYHWDRSSRWLAENITGSLSAHQGKSEKRVRSGLWQSKGSPWEE